MIDANYEERLRALQEALAQVGEVPGVEGGRQFTPPGGVNRPIVSVRGQETVFQTISMPSSGNLSEGVEVRV